MKLSEREQEVLKLIAAGQTSRQVAETLFVSKRTVDCHLDKIYRKLEVTNRIQALHKAQNLNLFVMIFFIICNLMLV